MPNEKVYLNRYAWVYFEGLRGDGQMDMQTFVSPDAEGLRLVHRPTPYTYQLTRNDVRYRLQSEVELSRKSAITIAGMLYDQEFVIAYQVKRRARRKK